MTRYLARRVEHAGAVHSLSIVEVVQTPDGLWHVKVYPFSREVHSTPYHNGTIRVVDPHDSSQPFIDGSPYPPELIL